jgi:hypothetical protein
MFPLGPIVFFVTELALECVATLKAHESYHLLGRSQRSVVLGMRAVCLQLEVFRPIVGLVVVLVMNYFTLL